MSTCGAAPTNSARTGWVPRAGSGRLLGPSKLGGLLSEDVTKHRDKVPLLGDIPFFGRLFRSESSKTDKRNLLIFVTPRIIDPAGNPVHTMANLPYDPNAIPPEKPRVK